MNVVDLQQALASLGLPVAYGEFEGTPQKPAPGPPCIVYQYAFDSDVKADNVNYAGIGNYQVELYTSKKDLAREKLVQDKLTELGIPYSKSETRLQTERLYQIVYSIQLIGG